MKQFTRWRMLAITPLLALALAACGSLATDSSASTSHGEASAAPHATGPGIDQTKIDVCAKIPRDKVEAAIGALVEVPQPSIPIGSEVGCGYTVDQGRGYAVTYLNLDRWEVLPQFLDLTPVAGLGDGAYLEQKKLSSQTELYVLVRDVAVVSVRVNGADTPQLRRLLDVALAAVRA